MSEQHCAFVGHTRMTWRTGGELQFAGSIDWLCARRFTRTWLFSGTCSVCQQGKSKCKKQQRVQQDQYDAACQLLKDSQPPLCFVLLGKTGVGKSTLTNYLSGVVFKPHGRRLKVACGNDTLVAEIGDTLKSQTLYVRDGTQPSTKQSRSPAAAG